MILWLVIKASHQRKLSTIKVTDFPEVALVLASMFYHFEPDIDFAIRCINKSVVFLY
jgi:hypothetical protein